MIARIDGYVTYTLYALFLVKHSWQSSLHVHIRRPNTDGIHKEDWVPTLHDYE